ncbi:hypothetical protein [Rouxiella sp. WC2420]|uniref:Uncharacterized protein n=1 Tax=Rouxiella sp. WC2420 TaxID=3234145 RepID=A0AB39VYS0_9GAMM
MTIETNYPGVYVKEDNALSLNITSGSTAVPVFVFEPLVSATKGVTDIIPSAGVLKKFNGWLEYLKFYNLVVSASSTDEVFEFKVTVSAGSEKKFRKRSLQQESHHLIYSKPLPIP